MVVLDSGTVEFGALKSYFREYFLHGKHVPQKLTVRQLPNAWRKKSLHSGEESKTGQGYTVWFTFASEDDPYVLSKRALEKKWYPPAHVSALPKELRSKIPPQFQYWKKDKNYHKTRDNLIKLLKNQDDITNFILSGNLSKMVGKLSEKV